MVGWHHQFNGHEFEQTPGDREGQGIPGTAEPGGLPSMGPHRVGHDGSDLAAAAAAVVLY